ncbi:hypothetical protein R3P38DRAFT_3211600 [Favolaschia claudopus]|uniref:Uncharacterized protein n=1 Tax=Favolaschia claudopus TaxID=2862362 RepID=A0AAW0AF65_9AGAR
MDTYYAHQEAAETVQIWSVKSTETNSPLVKCRFAQPACDLDTDLVTVKKFDEGETGKIFIADGSGSPTEAIFTIVGVLCAQELPPVKRHSFAAKRVPYARQYAGIVGYGAPAFDLALSNLSSVAYEMAVAFGTRDIVGWKIEKSHTIGGSELSSSCRYFTVGRKIPEGDKIPFANAVDPYGVLTAFVTETVAHCVDNDVLYMQFKNNQCFPKDPSTFQNGDIVEMGVSLVTWRTGKHNSPERKYTSKLVLRSLTLLDNTLSKKAYFARQAPQTLPSAGDKRIRPIEQGEHGDGGEESEARRKLARMHIDDDIDAL